MALPGKRLSGLCAPKLKHMQSQIDRWSLIYVKASGDLIYLSIRSLWRQKKPYALWDSKQVLLMVCSILPHFGNLACMHLVNRDAVYLNLQSFSDDTANLSRASNQNASVLKTSSCSTDHVDIFLLEQPESMVGTAIVAVHIRAIKLQRSCTTRP